jgi:hypothetical protein
VAPMGPTKYFDFGFTIGDALSEAAQNTTTDTLNLCDNVFFLQ